MSNAISLRTPKYRHHKAKGLAVVTIAGRDLYLGKHGTAASKQRYRKLVAEYLQRDGISPQNSQDEITVPEVMTDY